MSGEINVIKNLVAKLKLDTSEFDKGVKDATKQTGNLKQGTDKAAGGVDNLGKSLTRSIGTYTAITAAVGLAIKAFDQLKKTAEEGAKLDRLAKAGENLAKTFGSSMDSIVKSVKSASLGTISELDIIASSNKAMMLGLGADAETLGDLMEVAAFRAKAMGMATTAAYDDIIRGIGRMSPLILDNLGIVFDSEKTYQEYAASIGKTKDELSEAEKKQALLTATIKEGNKMMKEAGGLTRDAATAYEQYSAFSKNAYDNFKRGIGEWFAPFMEGLNRGLFGKQLQSLFLDALKGMDVTQFESYGEYLGQAVATGIQTGLIKESWSDTLTQALMSQDEIKAFIDKYITGTTEYKYYGGNRVKTRYSGDLRATWQELTEGEKATAALINQLNALSYQMGGTGIKSLEDFTTALGIMTEGQYEAQTATQKLFGEMAAKGILQKPSGGMWTADEPSQGWEFDETYQLAELEKFEDRMETLNAYMTGTMGKANEEFAAQQAGIQNEMAKVNEEIEKYLSWGWSEQGSKIKELREEYENLGAEYDQNAADHEEATRRIIFNMLQVQAAEQGFTDSTFFYDLAFKWGLIDEATRNAMQASAEFMSLLKDELPIPISLLDELGIKLEDLPDEVRARVIIDTEYTYTGYDGTYPDAGGIITIDPYKEQHAAGGVVFPGELLSVNERGTEGFIPATAGRIIPASELHSMGNGQGTNEALLTEIRLLPMTMKVALKEAMQTLEV